jgi:hypothetical protein
LGYYSPATPTFHHPPTIQEITLRKCRVILCNVGVSKYHTVADGRFLHPTHLPHPHPYFSARYIFHRSCNIGPIKTLKVKSSQKRINFTDITFLSDKKYYKIW